MRQLHNSLTSTHINGLDNTILSLPEWQSGSRLVDGENLCQVMPDPAGTRAQRAIARYEHRTKGYQVVVNPHGTPVPHTEFATYGPGASPHVRAVVSYLGLTRAIVRDEGIETVLSNVLSIETGLNTKSLSPEQVHEKLVALTQGESLEQLPTEEYAYVINVPAIIAKQLSLRPRYEAFEPLTRHDSDALSHILGLEAVELFAACWDADRFDDSVGFRGELLTRFPFLQREVSQRVPLA